MRKKSAYLVLLFISAFGFNAFSQQRLKVAIFSPLYLDSAFDAGMNYKHGKNFPKYFNSGLEFYEGVQKAVDSLEKQGMPLDLFVHDSRSQNSSVNEVISSGDLDSMDLIIGHVNANEAKALATAAAGKNIPFINATYPNDAGVTNNPNFVILNSTLYTHCFAIYKFIQKNYSLAPVVSFRKKGAQEDRLQDYFEEIAKVTSSVPLKIKYITLEDGFTAEDVKEHLDEDRRTVVIAGSLDINFANNLAQSLASLYTTQTSVLFGMPTWWDATDFSKPEYKDIEVFYSTPFYISSVHPFALELTNWFKTKFYSRPTDMFFRGYEALFHFTHLLQLNGKNFGSSLSDKRFKVFTDFDIQPILDPKTSTLEYFENKKIYFVKKVNGTITAVY
jgi:hypothetical protein